MPKPALQFVDEILQSFHLPDADLSVITEQFIEAFQRGLDGDPKGLAMAPSFMTRVPDGTENGTFLTLDFEPTAFRVAQVKLDGQRKFTFLNKIFEISNEIKGGETAQFFDYTADCVEQFLAENRLQGNSNKPLPLGMTFGFPLEKTSIDNAKLVAWTKGFSMKNGVGKNVTKLLQDALDHKNIPVKCIGIVNDTVATFLSQSYLSGGCVLAATFGIGTNGAFPEEVSKIKKLKGFAANSPEKKMLLNTEWGAFDNKRAVLPSTPYDNKLHRESLRPGLQSFEEMVSWMYLGEIARNVIVSLIDNSPSILLSGTSTPAMNTQFGFDSYYLTLIEQAATLSEVRTVLVDHLGFKPEIISDADLNIVRKVCKAVTTRSARLAACAVAGALIYNGLVSRGGYGTPGGEKLHVAVNGELILVYPEFQNRLREAIVAIIGKDAEKRLDFIKVEDGGALGAALCAFEAAQA